jgi:hypothetical protein
MNIYFCLKCYDFSQNSHFFGENILKIITLAQGQSDICRSYRNQAKQDIDIALSFYSNLK